MGIGHLYKPRHAKRNALQELAALAGGAGPGLQDVGVSEGHLADLVRHAGQRPLWSRMAEALAVATEPILHDVRRIDELASRCSGCGLRRACRRWFDGASANGSRVMSGCPNRAAFASLPRRHNGVSRGIGQRHSAGSMLRYLAVNQPGEPR